MLRILVCLVGWERETDGTLWWRAIDCLGDVVMKIVDGEEVCFCLLEYRCCVAVHNEGAVRR